MYRFNNLIVPKRCWLLLMISNDLATKIIYYTNKIILGLNFKSIEKNEWFWIWTRLNFRNGTYIIYKHISVNAPKCCFPFFCKALRIFFVCGFILYVVCKTFCKLYFFQLNPSLTHQLGLKCSLFLVSFLSYFGDTSLGDEMGFYFLLSYSNPHLRTPNVIVP